MNTALRYISISHKTASAAQRERYYISEDEKNDLIENLQGMFSDITGLCILTTCNRTEIYLESTNTPAAKLRDFIIDLKKPKNKLIDKKLFEYSNDTKKTLVHLLEVSSGLTSSVLGDTEVIHQVKKAYQFSVEHQLQGSLLERAMQAAFRNHKRISNETHFRDGTTSIAYRSLKIIENTFTKDIANSKKILFIGAGDIVKQLFKYNSKFNYSNIYISNRTEEKAFSLAQANQCKVYAWKDILANNFHEFDVIISAVSNSPLLIKSIPNSLEKVLLIDLAMPGNIDPSIEEDNACVFYNLDTISIELENNKATRIGAIEKVENIIKEELKTYLEWLHKAPLREALTNYKKIVDQKINEFTLTHSEISHEINTKLITDQIMRKILNKNEVKLPQEVIDKIVYEHISLVTEPSLN